MADYDGKNEFLKELINMYFRRDPLKLVNEQTRLIRQTMPAGYHSLMLLKNNKDLLKELATASRIPIEWIFIDASKPIDLVSEEEAAILIEVEEDSDDTSPIAIDGTSIISGLRDVERICLRMYTKHEYKDRLHKTLKERYFMSENHMS